MRVEVLHDLLDVTSTVQWHFSGSVVKELPEIPTRQKAINIRMMERNLGGADCVGSTLARPKMTWLFPHATMYLSPECADNPNYEFGDFYILSNSNSNKRVTTWSFF